MYFQGVISATGGSGLCNTNQPSGAFTLPPGTKAVWLQPDTTGAMFQFYGSASAGASFGCPTGSAAMLGAPNVLQGPFRTVNAPVIGVTCLVAGGVRVKVFLSPTS